MPRTPHISPLSLRPLILAGALLLLCLSSCSRVQSIREARTIVAEADSLRNAGQSLSPFTFHLSPSKSDSTAMADAAATLQRVRLIYPTAYAHANYYYGRLLREAGNQPEAMLAFLRVIHSRTQDHVIKARAYSNMGTMSHAGGEFALSYDMYVRTAEHFMLACDTIAYNYARVEMAIELAELSMHDETLALIDDIVQKCTYLPVVAKAYEAQAILYFNIEHYDSVLYSIEQLQAYGNHEPTGYVKKAQAFWCMANYDSALVYAKQVMDMPNASPRDQYNMLYILTYNDSTIDSEQIRQLSEERSDVDRYIIDPWLTQLTQAIELLKFDIAQKPDLRWLYATILTSVIIGIVLSMYIKRKRRKHQLISQQVDNLRQEQATLSSQTQHLKSVNTECEEQVKHNISLFCQKVLSSPNPQEVVAWGDYKQMRTIINENFFGLADKLEDLGLADHEVRFCVLVLLRFNRKKSAEWMRLGVASIGGKKRDIAMKLGQTSAHLYDFLLSLALK